MTEGNYVYHIKGKENIGTKKLTEWVVERKIMGNITTGNETPLRKPALI